MTSLLQFTLISHVLFGVLGIVAFYAIWMGLLKKQIRLQFVRYCSLVGTILLLLSWLSGGYYYTTYYGSTVKPIIKAGPFPLAHAIIMESKEHIFLFLPFLGIAVMLALWLLPWRDDSFPVKRSLAAVSGTCVILGTAIALGGIVISGAVR